MLLPLAATGGGARRASRGEHRSTGIEGRPLETTLYVDGQLALVDDMLHYFDRASMAHSLEVRVPFLDHHLVEYCATIPDQPQGARPDAEAPAPVGGEGDRPRPRAREEEGRLLHRRHGHVVPSAGGRRDRGVPARRDDPRYAAVLDPRRGRAARSRPVVDGRHDRLLVVDPDARVWLRDYLPRATGDGSPARERIQVPA